MEDGAWYADRREMNTFGNRHYEEQTRVGMQYMEDACSVDGALCDSDRVPGAGRDMPVQSLQRQLNQTVVNLTGKGIAVLAQYSWPYFHHFPLSSLKAGRPWDILDMQGRRSTWWLG